MTNGESCSSCRFYQINPQALEQGVCRIRSPGVFLVPGPAAAGLQSFNWISQWPPVRGEQWCGEWEGRSLQ